MKKKSLKGGQNTIAVESERRYIVGYTAHHKLWKRGAPFTAKGPAEFKRIVDILNPLVKGEVQDPSDNRRQIYDERPNLGMDNHFSGDATSKEVGENGWKCNVTCRRDRFPSGVPKKYFHSLKECKVDARSRVARFEEPIIAVKHVVSTEPGKKDYTIVHISFQSTGSTNIQCVNVLKEVTNFVRQRERGRGATKRFWAIEMNEGREIYLKTYSAVDKVDQMLKEWEIFYICWKWWHAPMRHGKAIGYCMAYQMYKECAEGSVNRLWKLDKPMSATEFRERASLQMCQYQSSHKRYPGDAEMRTTTQKPKLRRGMEKQRLEKDENEKFRVSYAMYLDAKLPRGKESALCTGTGSFKVLKEHLNSWNPSSTKGRCQMCGNVTYAKCEKCNRHCCWRSDKKKAASLSCCLDMHDENYLGLSMDEQYSAFGVPKMKFRKPSAKEVKKNAKHVKALRERWEKEMRDKDNNPDNN